MSIEPLTSKQAQLPIGVFDSGMGGLTVLRELKRLLPQESLIYLGDTARLPYGTKSLETITRYAKQMADILIQQNIKMLVIACNTATTAALEYLQLAFPNLPIIGVVEPGAITAVNTTKTNIVSILATETTIRSNIYERTIQRYNVNIKILNQACGLFVALAEEGCINDELAMCAVSKYLKPLIASALDCDCIVLGCTHFPVLKSIIQNFVGEKINIVDSAQATAMTVQHVLQTKNLQKTDLKNSYRFLVTDQPHRFARVATTFYGEPIELEAIELVEPLNLLDNSDILLNKHG